MKVVNVVEDKSMLNLVYILLAAPFGLAILNYLISSFYRIALWRFIPCCNRTSSPVFITQLFKHLIIFTLTFGYSLAILLQQQGTNTTYLILHYRAFNRLFHAPYAASLESFVLFIVLIIVESDVKLRLLSQFNFFLILFIIHVALHRLMIFFNKLVYVLVSLTTACKNKK